MSEQRETAAEVFRRIAVHGVADKNTRQKSGGERVLEWAEDSQKVGKKRYTVGEGAHYHGQ